MNRHSLAVHLTSVALLVCIVVVILGPEENLGRRGLLAASSLVAMALGQHMFTRRNRFHMVETTGMLEAYEPPMHPSTLKMVFHEMVRTHMDPLLRSNYEDLLIEMAEHLHKNIDRDLAVEELIIIMYRIDTKI